MVSSRIVIATPGMSEYLSLYTSYLTTLGSVNVCYSRNCCQCVTLHCSIDAIRDGGSGEEGLVPKDVSLSPAVPDDDVGCFVSVLFPFVECWCTHFCN